MLMSTFMNILAVRGSAARQICAVWVAALTVLPSTALYASSAEHIPLTKAVAAPEGFSTVCDRYSWACARSGGPAATAAELLAVAQEVNSRINRQTREIADDVQYAKPQFWALPTDRGGDCEDFALVKKQSLIASGVPPELLLIATVLDRKRQPHAVLVLRTDRGDYVLDNLTNQIVNWRQTGYTFLRMQNPESPRHWSAVLAGGSLGS